MTLTSVFILFVVAGAFTSPVEKKAVTSHKTRTLDFWLDLDDLEDSDELEDSYEEDSEEVDKDEEEDSDSDEWDFLAKRFTRSTALNDIINYNVNAFVKLLTSRSSGLQNWMQQNFYE